MQKCTFLLLGKKYTATATAIRWPYSLIHLQSPERLDTISATWISVTLSIREIMIAGTIQLVLVLLQFHRQCQEADCIFVHASHLVVALRCIPRQATSPSFLRRTFGSKKAKSRSPDHAPVVLWSQSVRSLPRDTSQRNVRSRCCTAKKRVSLPLP